MSATKQEAQAEAKRGPVGETELEQVRRFNSDKARSLEYWQERDASNQKTIQELKALLQQAIEDKDVTWTPGWMIAARAALASVDGKENV